jgi:REP element-mobilizing transposase RayT
MARGNARQDIVHDDDDRRRLLVDLERAVVRCDWELFAFVVLSNHLHLLLKTPRPNLAKGMQAFLSAYAQWSGRRRRRSGHLFQGRYRAEMIEDESYYWTVSRYVHLNPVRAGLVVHPEQWAWSSYPGYCQPKRCFGFVAYDALLMAWQGDRGGDDPSSAYVAFVEAGIEQPPASPFREAFGGWILGSERFVGQLRSRAGPVAADPAAPEARRLAALDPAVICAAVVDHYGLDASALRRRHDPHVARAVAAWLSRRYSEASLRELAVCFNLSRAASVPNLTRRLEASLKTSPRLERDLVTIMRQVTQQVEGATLGSGPPRTAGPGKNKTNG